jgi:hypothetical protein
VVECSARNRNARLVDPAVVVDCPNECWIALSLVVADEARDNASAKESRDSLHVSWDKLRVPVTVSRIVARTREWLQAEGPRLQFVL